MILIVQETVWPGGHKIRLLWHNWKKIILVVSSFMSLQTSTKEVGIIHHPQEQEGEQNFLPQTRSCHPLPCLPMLTSAFQCTRAYLRRDQNPGYIFSERKSNDNAVEDKNIISVLWSLWNVPNGLDSKRTEKPMEKPWFRQCSVKYVCIHFPLG